MIENITYGQLTEILIDMGFVEHTVPDSHTGYRHDPSDTVILLAPHPCDQFARPLDVKYIRRVLDEKGLLDANEFNHRIAEAISSHTA